MKFFSFFIGIFIILTLSSQAKSDGTLILKSSQGSYSLGPSLKFYPDKKGVLSFKDITSPTLAEKFRPLGTRTNFGYSPHTYWFKINISNQDPQQKEYFLTIRPPQLDLIEFYKKEKNHWEVSKTSDFKPFRQRERNNRNFVFKINPGQFSTYFIKIKSTSFIPVNMTLEKESEFLANNSIKNLIYGLFFGVLLTLVTTNLFVFFFVKQKANLLYSIYLFSFAFYNLIFSGFGHQYFFPNFILPPSEVFIWATIFLPVSAFYFLRDYLKINPQTHLYKIIHYYACLWAIPLITAFFSLYSISILLTHILTFLGVFLFFIIIYNQYKHFKIESLFTLSALSFLILARITDILYVNNALPKYDLFVYGYEIGGILQCLIFSMGLAYHIKTIKDKSLRNQIRAKVAQERAAQKLILEVEKQTIELKKKNEKLQEYGIIVAHDLKNPIGAILTYAEIYEMKKEKSPEKSQKIVHDIKKVATKAMKIIDGILKVVISGDLKLQKQSLDGILKWSLDQLKTKIEDGRAIIKKDFHILSLFCDDFTMEQIFTNLIDNAIKYKSPNKQPIIEISAWEQDNLIYISFKDNGIGIPAAKHGNIFEKEVRAVDNTSTIKGHGLGLYNAKKMVEANKGKIELTHSAPGEGSLFTLSFPTYLD